MPTSYWGYWLVVMGVAIVGLMIQVQGITTNTTQDSYAIREITDAAMLESVDYGYYRDYNEIKINKEKFMEVFIRMIAEVMGVNDTYYDTTTRIDAIIQIHAEEVVTTSGN